MHIYETRVYYDNTDAGGVTYHSEYLKFAEHGRTEWLRSLELQQQILKETHDCLFVVRSLQIDYKSPARLDDLIRVETKVISITRVRLVMEQLLKVGENIKAILKVEVIIVNQEGQPKRLPDFIMEKLLP